MLYTVFGVGFLSAAILLAFLTRTYVNPQVRIWPPPGPESWQSLLFWPLFRLLNIAVFAAAIVDIPGCAGVPSWLRGLAVVGLAASGVAYGYALIALGKTKTYCRADGLVTDGIYRWTRNPQYATVIPVYVCLALAADSAFTYPLAAAMIAVYVMMALVEEPWLEACYGPGYRRYLRRVPRFFNWRRARVLAGWMLRTAGRQVQTRIPI